MCKLCYRRSSFLPEPIGKLILPGHVDFVEDPSEPYGLASGPFDDEGIGGTSRSIVSAGIVQGLFLDSRSARQLRLPPTGNASGPYNLTLSSRLKAGGEEELLRRMGTGLLVTNILGGETEPIRGGWSRAVAGFWVENGCIAYPVEDVTLAGDMPSMLQGIVAIGEDVERVGVFRTGSVLVADMQLGGAL